MADSQRIPWTMRIPPPLLFVATFLAGVGLQRVIRLAVPVNPAMRLLGLGLVGCGALLALYSVATFLTARTTVIPFSDASRLVTWGPYRITRNPMYVSLVIAYVGVATLSSQLLPVLFLPGPVLWIARVIIPFEEERMRKVFGEAYEQYCLKVPRWL